MLVHVSVLKASISKDYPQNSDGTKSLFLMPCQVQTWLFIICLASPCKWKNIYVLIQAESISQVNTVTGINRDYKVDTFHDQSKKMHLVYSDVSVCGIISYDKHLCTGSIWGPLWGKYLRCVFTESLFCERLPVLLGEQLGQPLISMPIIQTCVNIQYNTLSSKSIDLIYNLHMFNSHPNSSLAANPLITTAIKHFFSSRTFDSPSAHLFQEQQSLTVNCNMIQKLQQITLSHYSRTWDWESTRHLKFHAARRKGRDTDSADRASASGSHWRFSCLLRPLGRVLPFSAICYRTTKGLFDLCNTQHRYLFKHTLCFVPLFVLCLRSSMTVL